MSLIEVKHFINGEFAPSSDGTSFELKSPYTREVVAKVAEGTKSDIDRAVKSASEAFPAWSAISPQQRGRPLGRLAELIESATPELTRLDAIAMGRPMATYWDANYAALQFRYFSEAGMALGSTSLNTPGFVNLSLRQPYGVAAAIIPWNLPLVFLSKKAAPALAAGNTLVLKTSEKAPLSADLLAHLIREAGFPPGVFNIVHGHGQVSGEALSTHMQVRVLSFTGSVRAGRAIQRAAAESNFKHLILEMGGKSPALVFADADLDKAVAETQHSIMWRSGQTCFANSRIYVQRAIAKAFIVRFNMAASQRRPGDPTLPETDTGPQADQVQYDMVHSYIDLGIESGKLMPTAFFEREGPGLFVAPTIFLDQPQDSRVMREEIFGPVVCINVFDTEEEAVRLANDSEYGLYAAVYTRDLDRAMRVAKRLESGVVGVNCTSPTTATELPYGGYKQSGVGRESLTGSLEEWLESKTVMIKIEGL